MRLALRGRGAAGRVSVALQCDNVDLASGVGRQAGLCGTAGPRDRPRIARGHEGPAGNPPRQRDLHYTPRSATRPAPPKAAGRAPVFQAPRLTTLVAPYRIELHDEAGEVCEAHAGWPMSRRTSW